MKKLTLIVILFLTAISVFAQRMYTVGVLPFEASGAGVSAGDASEANRLVLAELGPITTLTVRSAAQAEGSDYLINGQVSRQNNQIVLTATITLASTKRVLNTVSERGGSLSAINIFSICAQLTDYIPYPYIIGKWQSVINMIDGPVTCILELRSDRTIVVEQYDTWEHNGANSLKYQAIGTGTYSFSGYHLRRTITVNGQRILADAAIGINLTLEDALPKYNTVSSSGQRIVFDESKRSFELVNEGFPCGDNMSGPSVYPAARVFYTKFTKIQ